jgi:hypothetical protein
VLPAVNPQHALHLVKHFALMAGGMKTRVRRETQLDDSTLRPAVFVHEGSGQQHHEFSAPLGVVGLALLFLAKFLWIRQKFQNALISLAAFGGAQRVSILGYQKVHFAVTNLDDEIPGIATNFRPRLAPSIRSAPPRRPASLAVTRG